MHYLKFFKYFFNALQNFVMYVFSLFILLKQTSKNSWKYVTRVSLVATHCMSKNCIVYKVKLDIASTLTRYKARQRESSLHLDICL